MPFSASLISAILVQVICQLFKVVLYSIKDRKLKIRYFFSAGGMPSAHSAFVTALSLSIGLRLGFASEHFTVASVFSIIIIYDSFRLRGAVQSHAQLLQRMMVNFPEERETKLNLMVGHSPAETLAGIGAGGLLALLIFVFMLGGPS